MLPSDQRFKRSVRRQVEINQLRTPTERFQAMLDLLDLADAMQAQDPASRERRRREKKKERERHREQLKRFLAAHRIDRSSRV